MSLIIARSRTSPFLQVVQDDLGRSVSRMDIDDAVSRYVSEKAESYGNDFSFISAGAYYSKTLSFEGLTPQGIKRAKQNVRSSLLRLEGECECEIFSRTDNRDFVVLSALTKCSNLVIVDDYQPRDLDVLGRIDPAFRPAVLYLTNVPPTITKQPGLDVAAISDREMTLKTMRVALDGILKIVPFESDRSYLMPRSRPMLALTQT